MTSSERACLTPILERLGIPWVVDDERMDKWNGWSGESMNLGRYQDGSGVLHEVAHWLVAAPERRRLADFGLGDDSGDVGNEMLASLLGILMERHLGLDWKDTWGFHNWDDRDDRPGKGWHARDHFRALQKRGLLHGLTPTCFREGKTRS